ncbi:UNVERIFIED_CONTAM: hypothetical protein Q9R58_17670 [Methylobacteriaceae bacterium AG10]|nr:hypothetical protein [Methylobacteriaceae bacterium AG10]
MARPVLDEIEIMKAVRSGERHAAIAERFGCTRPRISQIARKHGYDSQAAFDARRAKARAEKLARVPPAPEPPKPLKVVGLPVDVPAWVARAGLASDYRDFARDFDDDRAARECRRLLADLRRMEALDARLGAAA